MTRTFLILAATLVLAGSGCLRSFHPLYSDETIVSEPALIGTWIDKDTSAWTFVQTNHKEYELIYTEGNSPGQFEARLVKLGKYTFLDLFPKEPTMQNGLYRFHLLPVHSISRVWIEKARLRITMLNEDWLKDLLDKKKIEISHEQRENEIVLTATTAELQRLVVKYADDPKAFPEPAELHRLK